jgi:DNA adenine methylase
MIAFNYYGSKIRMVQDILQYLPEPPVCEHYCEPFAGSLSILLNRRPTPIETANDLNGDIVNFFRVLRKSGKRLVKDLQLMPYSRAEFEEAWLHSDDSYERALRFYIRMSMDVAKAGRSGDKSWAVSKTYDKNQFSYSPANFIRKVAGLPEVIERLKRVQIECRPAEKVIKRFDTATTVFYCDPPYFHGSRTSKKDYYHEMNEAAHISLADTLNRCKGMVALSGYDDPLMTELYPDDKWKKITFGGKQVPMSKGKGRVTEECLWVNYPVSVQLKMF